MGPCVYAMRYARKDMPLQRERGCRGVYIKMSVDNRPLLGLRFGQLADQNAAHQ